jgi:hypothetical protein
MYKAISSLLLFFYIQSSNAAIVWNWEFETSSLTVGTDERISLNINLTNDNSSDSSLFVAGFNLGDGTWGGTPSGLIFNDENEVIAIPSIFTEPFNAEVAPGETLQLIGGELLLMNLIGGETLTIDPLFYVKDDPAFGVGYLLGQNAIQPLQINVAPVPLPAAFWLFLSGLFLVKYMTSRTMRIPALLHSHHQPA